MVSLMVVLSFVFIPVRCDASTAPHSIFISPNMLNQTDGHRHHGAGSESPGRAKSIAHHSPVTFDPDASDSPAHLHGQAADSNRSNASMEETAREHCAPLLGSGSDPASQQPVGATLDLPPTSIVSGSNALQPLDSEPLRISFGPTAILSGIATPPDSPPPESI